jgi:hypothetical protein
MEKMDLIMDLKERIMSHGRVENDDLAMEIARRWANA